MSHSREVNNPEGRQAEGTDAVGGDKASRPGSLGGWAITPRVAARRSARPAGWQQASAWSSGSSSQGPMRLLVRMTSHRAFDAGVHVSAGVFPAGPVRSVWYSDDW